VDDKVDAGSGFCTILHKTYLKNFDTLPTFSLDSKAIKAVQVMDEEDCAKKCLEEKSVSCRSFDFCLSLDATTDSKGNCLMHEFHIAANANQKRKEKTKGTDLKFNTNDTQCFHYARKFSVDFKKSTKQKWTDKVSSTVSLSDLSLESCAHHCAELAGKDCNAFEFCDKIDLRKKQVRTCRISKSRTTVGQMEKADDCGVYVKEAQVEEESFMSKKYSSGLVGWMAFLFILIGSGVGVGVWKAKLIYLG
jgi:hypothetical protein